MKWSFVIFGKRFGFGAAFAVLPACLAWAVAKGKLDSDDVTLITAIVGVIGASFGADLSGFMDKKKEMADDAAVIAADGAEIARMLKESPTIADMAKKAREDLENGKGIKFP